MQEFCTSGSVGAPEANPPGPPGTTGRGGPGMAVFDHRARGDVVRLLVAGGRPEQQKQVLRFSASSLCKAAYSSFSSFAST
jgi:hypothetical protein